MCTCNRGGFPLALAVSDTKYGAGKGVLSVSNVGGRGFWLTHSIPGYPSLSAADAKVNGYYSDSMRFGHSMLCMTLDRTSMEAVALILQLNKIKVPVHRDVYDRLCLHSHLHAHTHTHTHPAP